jgi:lysophospholipase L1-like esterase
MSRRSADAGLLAAVLFAATLLLGGCDGGTVAADPPVSQPPPSQPEPPAVPPVPEVPAPAPDPLAAWLRGGFAGKKVVFWGNSTVSNAVYFFDQLRSHTLAGRALEGLDPALILNYGSSGATLAALLNGQGMHPVSTVIAARPDLLVIRGPLINDVRLGATSQQQAETLLQAALDQIRAGSPDTAIVLTTENSLLSADVGGYGYVQPVDAAQRYTDIMRAAVLAMRDRYPGILVLDVMYLEYGTVSQAASPLMFDQLHPGEAGQRAEADLIASLIGKPLP